MCSYCGCQATQLIADLTREHEEIINAAGVMRRAAVLTDVDAARAATRVAALELASLLDPHTAGEEGGLFVELSALVDFTEYVLSLSEDHSYLDATLRRVADGALDDVEPFVRRLHLHIQREEDGLFPAAAMALDIDAWDRLMV